MKTLRQIQEEILSELSGKTLVGYIKKASDDREKHTKIFQHHMKTLHKIRLVDGNLSDPKNKETYSKTHAHAKHIMHKNFRRDDGIKRAYKTLEKK